MVDIQETIDILARQVVHVYRLLLMSDGTSVPTHTHVRLYLRIAGGTGVVAHSADAYVGRFVDRFFRLFPVECRGGGGGGGER